MLMKKELVVFSIPTLDGKITAALHAFIRGCEKESANPQVPWRFMTNIISGYSPAAYARNRLVELFLEDNDASRLWFLDADIIPDMTTAALLSVAGDITAGIYPVWGAAAANRQPSAKFCVYDRMTDGRYREKNIEGLTKPFYADSVATGCMIIKRRVLEDHRMRWPLEYHDVLADEDRELTPHDTPPVFRWHYLPNGKTMCSEDHDFCARAKGCGYTIRVHPEVKCGHVKSVDLMHVRQYREAGMREALEHAAA